MTDTTKDVLKLPYKTHLLSALAILAVLLLVGAGVDKVRRGQQLERFRMEYCPPGPDDSRIKKILDSFDLVILNDKEKRAWFASEISSAPHNAIRQEVLLKFGIDLFRITSWDIYPYTSSQYREHLPVQSLLALNQDCLSRELQDHFVVARKIAVGSGKEAVLMYFKDKVGRADTD